MGTLTPGTKVIYTEVATDTPELGFPSMRGMTAEVLGANEHNGVVLAFPNGDVMSHVWANHMVRA